MVRKIGLKGAGGGGGKGACEGGAICMRVCVFTCV